MLRLVYPSGFPLAMVASRGIAHVGSAELGDFYDDVMFCAGEFDGMDDGWASA